MVLHWYDSFKRVICRTIVTKSIAGIHLHGMVIKPHYRLTNNEHGKIHQNQQQSFF